MTEDARIADDIPYAKSKARPWLPNDARYFLRLPALSRHQACQILSGRIRCTESGHYYSDPEYLSADCDGIICPDIEFPSCPFAFISACERSGISLPGEYVERAKEIVKKYGIQNT